MWNVTGYWIKLWPVPSRTCTFNDRPLNLPSHIYGLDLLLSEVIVLWVVEKRYWVLGLVKLEGYSSSLKGESKCSCFIWSTFQTEQLFELWVFGPQWRRMYWTNTRKFTEFTEIFSYEQHCLSSNAKKSMLVQDFMQSFIDLALMMQYLI